MITSASSYRFLSKIIRMSSRGLHSLDTSPPVHREMTQTLQRDAFRKSVPVLAACVPLEKAAFILTAKQLKGFIIDLPRVKTVVPYPTRPDQKLVLLKTSQISELSQEAQDFLAEHAALVEHELALNYDYWLADEILAAILPEELLTGAPSGFSSTGHIAHLNLNKEYLPYKYLIGQVILDKNKSVRTVVNKLDIIHNQFRVFEMELLAGEPDYLVEHHESECTFKFDFSAVYWNSRLGTEHNRLVEIFEPQDVIADVFAGVGPFAIPAARKGCAVMANDLNPESYKYLMENISINKVTDTVRAFAEDGRDFIKNSAWGAFHLPFRGYVAKVNKSPKKKKARQNSLTEIPPRNRISHYVMNLPDTAIDFLDAFRGALSSPELRDLYETTPMVHCYCFSRLVNDIAKAEIEIRKRVEERLGCSIQQDVSYHLVRTVAPGKDMYCVSFRLPPEVAFAGGTRAY